MRWRHAKLCIAQGADLGGARLQRAPFWPIGIVLAWFVSGIPIYYWRWRIRQLEGPRPVNGGFFG